MFFESYPFTPEDAKSDRWRRILAWLVANGAPEPTTRVSESTFPGRPDLSFQETQIVFQKPGFAEEVMNAGLVLRGPGLALTHLEVAFKFGNPAVAKHFDYAPEQPTPLPGPTPLPPQPEDPVGAEILNAPGNYECLPGDKHQTGYVHVRPDGTRFRKVMRLTPFGSQVWWVKL